ncbi:hypothetical protein NP233_g11937 [Leucocoprinus birnbaumii]|uniref:G domain-containing protein n=1 Tax=Leucocoprinus birnbaumii TaxID=56174 RepID=A0AAD5YQF7_9AGAR|nr:hypothetical protein NP233_g11937 [Leucocoprinus birnbaumii]
MANASTLRMPQGRDPSVTVSPALRSFRRGDSRGSDISLWNWLHRFTISKDTGWIESGLYRRNFKDIDAIEPVTGPKELTKNDLVIVVMGPTGAGKSSLIQTVTKGPKGYDAGEVGHTLHSTTSRVSGVRIKFLSDHFSVVLVDTPGFDDTNRSDLEILNTIANWFQMIPDESKISGIAYLHRITDPRMTSTVVKNFDMFQKLCGRDFFRKVVLVTTMWPKEATPDPSELESRERDLKDNYWKPMILKGSTSFRYRNTEESAWTIFNHLLGIQQADDRLVLLVKIQQELVNEKKKVPATQAGKRLHGFMQDVVTKQAHVIGQLKVELVKSAGQDQFVINALLQELAQLAQERERARKEMAELDTSLMSSVRRGALRVATSFIPGPGSMSSPTTRAGKREDGISQADDPVLGTAD